MASTVTTQVTRGWYSEDTASMKMVTWTQRQNVPCPKDFHPFQNVRTTVEEVRLNYIMSISIKASFDSCFPNCHKRCCPHLHFLSLRDTKCRFKKQNQTRFGTGYNLTIWCRFKKLNRTRFGICYKSKVFRASKLWNQRWPMLCCNKTSKQTFCLSKILLILRKRIRY